MKNKFGQLLGIATKAGKTKSGGFQVEKAIKEGNVRLVIIAEDASENTKKHFKDMCAYREIPVITQGRKEELGAFTGQEERAVAAVLDEGFAGRLISIIREV